MGKENIQVDIFLLVAKNKAHLVSSLSLSISASFCFNERLNMLISFFSASVDRCTVSRSAFSLLFSRKKKENSFLFIPRYGTNNSSSSNMRLLRAGQLCKVSKKLLQTLRKEYSPTVSLEVSCCHSRFNRKCSCSFLTNKPKLKVKTTRVLVRSFSRGLVFDAGPQSRSTNQSINPATSQPANQTNKQTTSQQTNQPKKRANQSINEPINQVINLVFT